MRLQLAGLVALLALSLTGCPEDGNGGSAADAAATDGATIIDLGAGGMGGEGGMAGGGGVGGMGGDGGMGGRDAGPDAAPRDMGPPRDMFTGTDIESCEDACDRYGSCERLGEIFGDEDACLDRCARITRDGQRPGGWWDCLAVEECNLLQLCRVPEIQPLACDAVCARADECGVPFADCQAACAEAGVAFQQCGESLVGQCGVDAFVDCLGDNVYPACQRTCDQGVQCNILRRDGCLLDCVAGVADPDPLFSLIRNRRNQCVAQAGDDCARINECINLPMPGDAPLATPQEFCRLYSGCGFDDFFPCEDLLFEIGADPDFIACGIGELRGGCPFDPFSLFDVCQPGGGGGDGQALQFCNRLCEGQDVCDVLPADPLARPNCVQNCIGGQNADPDEVERAAAALACIGADRCPDLVTCLDQTGPAVECRDHCARLADCGLGFEGCEDDCDGRWARDRHAAYRTCVAEADACPAVQACEIAPSPPCAAYCARALECGIERGADCENRCDDAGFADPQGQLLFDACVISAAECVADNRNDPAAINCRARPTDGLACLGYCRAQTECGGGEVELGDCLRQCGRGFVGDDGLLFLSSRECLRQLPVDAACPALDACIPDSLDVDCAALCDRAAGCGVDLRDCAQSCAEDPLSRLRALQGTDCLAGAESCEDVRACLITEVRPPDPEVVRPFDPVRFCGAFDRCGLADFFGPCNGFLQDLGRDPEILRCIDDLIAGQCPANPDDIFICFDGVPEPPNPIAPDCAALCEARAFCGDPAAADQPACRRACEGLVNVDDADSIARVAPRLACAGAWSCPDLGACLAASAPADVCAAHCATLVECGVEANGAICAAACVRDFPRLRQFDYRACVRRAGDCAAVAACELAPGVPCAQACDALDGCGLAGDTCVNGCDDAHFRDPLATSLEVACLLSAEGCVGPDSIPACLEDPGPGARACLGYCRAVTECDPESDGTLLDCLNGCVGGFPDANGLRFAEARDCLGGVQPDADCRLVRACLPDELAVDCPAYCRALGECRLPDAGCALSCAAGEVSLDQAGCVADARRAGGGCGAMARCVGYEPPPAEGPCVRACELQSGCDRDVDPYLCRLDCTPTPPALPVQLGCAELAACGAELDACFDLPADLDPDCVLACAGVEACAGLFADAAACAAVCTGQDAGERTPDGWPAEVGQCLDRAIVNGRCDVAAAQDCFVPASCEGQDDIRLLPPNGGRFDVVTAGRADAYEANCGGQGPEAVLALPVRGNATVTVEVVQADYDPLIFARRDDCDDPGQEVACNDDFNGLNSRIQFQAEPGLYYIYIDGFGGDSGRSTVTVAVQPR